MCCFDKKAGWGLLVFSLTFISGESGFAQNLILTQTQPYSKIQKELKESTQETASSIYKDIEDNFKQACLKEKKNYKAFGKVINCEINILGLLRGKKQMLLKGDLKEGNLGKFSGAKVELTRPIKIKAEIEPILKNYKIPVLDYKKELPLEKKSVLHQNIYVKHTPQNSALYTTACIDLPGYKIKTSVSKIKARAKKKVLLFISLKAKIKVNLNLGEYKMDAAQICGAAKTVVKDIDLKNYQSIAQVQRALATEQIFLAKPKMSGITQKGLKVKDVDVSGSNFITKIIFAIIPKVKSSVVKQVKKSIEKDLKKQTQSLVKVTNNNLTSGKVWDQLVKQLAIASSVELTKNLNKSINQSIRENSKDNIVIDNKTIGDICSSILSNAGSSGAIEFISDKCKNLVNRFEIAPFAKDKDMENKGCYDYYYTPFDNYTLANKREKNTWWKSECGIITSVKVFPQSGYEGSAECLATAVSLKWSLEKTMKECSEVVISEHLGIKEDQLESIIKSKSLTDLEKNFTKTQIKKFEKLIDFKRF